MPLAKTQVADWFDRGRRDGFAYMLVVLDPLESDHYPFYAKDSAAAIQLKNDCKGPDKPRLRALYDLRQDKATQIAEDGIEISSLDACAVSRGSAPGGAEGAIGRPFTEGQLVRVDNPYRAEHGALGTVLCFTDACGWHVLLRDGPPHRREFAAKDLRPVSDAGEALLRQARSELTTFDRLSLKTTVALVDEVRRLREELAKYRGQVNNEGQETATAALDA